MIVKILYGTYFMNVILLKKKGTILKLYEFETCEGAERLFIVRTDFKMLNEMSQVFFKEMGDNKK